MPVKVGNSYVTEAALAFAQKSAAESVDKEKTKGKGANGVLADLAEKFPKLKFTVGTQPFSGSGKGNVAISPKILREMEKDPAKREEVGALPVRMYKGLWYQASWGDDLNALTPGTKFQADGTQTHIGVIKQKGSKGFYRLNVSEK